MSVTWEFSWVVLWANPLMILIPVGRKPHPQSQSHWCWPRWAPEENLVSISATQLSQLMVIHVSTGNQVLNKRHLINSCSAPRAEWAKKHKQWWLRLGSQCKEEEQWRLTAMDSRWRDKMEGEACACCGATQQSGEANADLPEKTTGLSTRSLVWWPWMEWSSPAQLSEMDTSAIHSRSFMETGSHYLA